MDLPGLSGTQIWRRGFLLVTCLLGFFLASCSEGGEDQAPAIIRVGILPDQSNETLQDIYGALLDHFSDHSDLGFELIIPDDYAHLVTLFASNQIDIGYFGGVTFLQAEAKANAIPLVMRNVDREFASVLIARNDNGGSELADFKGKRLAFGSKFSTSGHLMPRHFLFAEGLGVEDYFSDVTYTGSHDATALQVRDGRADLGALNASIYDRLVETGQLNPEEVRVIGRTPPYANYVWAARPELGEEVISEIRDVFLELTTDNAEHSEILARIGADYFLPAAASDFNSLRVVAAGLGIVGFAPEIGLIETGERKTV